MVLNIEEHQKVSQFINQIKCCTTKDMAYSLSWRKSEERAFVRVDPKLHLLVFGAHFWSLKQDNAAISTIVKAISGE